MVKIDPDQNARALVLAEAANAVLRDRNTSYGDPEDNFRNIARLWSEFKGVEFTLADVAIFMALVKIARLKHSPAHQDNWVDLAGYAACGLAAAIKDKDE